MRKKNNKYLNKKTTPKQNNTISFIKTLLWCHSSAPAVKNFTCDCPNVSDLLNMRHLPVVTIQASFNFELSQLNQRWNSMVVFTRDLCLKHLWQFSALTSRNFFFGKNCFLHISITCVFLLEYELGITQEVFQSNCLSFINHAFIVHLLLSFALRSRPAFIIVKLCFAFSDDETSGPHVVAISLLSFLLGLTWLILALISIYKKRYHSVHQNNKPGGESIHLEEAPNMTQQYDGAHGMVVDQLEAENMNLDNVDEEGLVV